MSSKFQREVFYRKQGGFTIIEALLAMAIFSIGILAVASLQLWNVKNNTTGNITTQASMLAREKMEELKGVSDVRDLASTGELGVAQSDPNNPVDPEGNTGGIFTRNWTVSNPFGGNSSRQIQVTVSWNRRGQSRSVQISTITRGNGI